ncbi:MAG: SOS response-associated peptidase [Chitinophagaceae bacterium]
MKLKIELTRLGMDVEVPNYEPYFHLNGFDHGNLPVLTQVQYHQISLAQWGLLPSWAKDYTIAAKTLNAVSETAFEKPAFLESMRHSRCLIWVDGFFEWQQRGKTKQPYFIYFPGSRPFALGGLYSEWLNPATNTILPTCSILTTEANELMATIHNSKRRMPLILEKKNWDIWFDRNSAEIDLQKVMKPYTDDILQAHPVSNRILEKNKDSNVLEVQAEMVRNTLF